MIDFSKINIERVCMHFIGNKGKNEGLKLSLAPLIMDKDLENILIKYFLNPFKSQEYYSFFHETSLNYNEIYSYIRNVFNNSNIIFDQSISIAKHLYKHSHHPQIKSGEFYVVYFRDCIVDNNVVDAIGLFKSENKDTFLKISSKDGDLELQSETGINVNKLDKGCVIYNIEEENGYIVSIVDNTNKVTGSEAQYWINSFLQVKRHNDAYFQTQKVLSLCKQFAEEEFSSDEASSKIAKADFLNKSLSFFKENSNFNLEEFGEKVFQGSKIKENFQEYRNDFEQKNQINIEQVFDISNSALKKQATSYSSVIKLDQNFHIYIHGDTSLIQNGLDEETGLNYYKFLYNEER